PMSASESVIMSAILGCDPEQVNEHRGNRNSSWPCSRLLQYCLACRLASPSSDHGHERSHCLRHRHFGLKSLWKRIEVAQRFKRDVPQLNLPAQAGEKIVRPSCEVRLTPKQHLYTHARCRQVSFQEHLMELDSYLHIRPRLTHDLMEQRCRGGKQRQAGTKCEKGGVRHLLKGKDTAWTNQLRQTAQNGNGIRNPLQNKTAHCSVKRFGTSRFGDIAFRETDVRQSSIADSSHSPGD